ncbi:MAG: DUF4124 domain-containing protein [Lautropia sp.]
MPALAPEERLEYACRMYPARSPMRLVRRAAALALVLVATGARAQDQERPGAGIYSCTDANGRIITSDRPIPDCAKRELRVLNADGSVREIISAPLTKEQQKQRARDEQRRVEEAWAKKVQQKQRARDEQRRVEEAWAKKVQQARDRNLLQTFEDERAIESLRRRTIADIDHEIKLATLRILSLDKEMKIAQQEVERFRQERAGSRIPFVYQQRITDAANAILAEDALIKDRREERERANARFDADSKRLSELLGRPVRSAEASKTGS